MSLPLALIGTVVSQVVLSKSSASLREGRLLSKHQFSKILLALFSVGLMISCVIYFSALYVMPFLVGSEWVEAGEILRLIAPFLLITFIWNSVSSLFYARKLWKSFFVVTLIRLMALILGAIASYELELIFSHTLLTIMFFGVLAQLSAIFFLFHGLSNLPKEKLTKKKLTKEIALITEEIKKLMIFLNQSETQKSIKQLQNGLCGKHLLEQNQVKKTDKKKNNQYHK